MARIWRMVLILVVAVASLSAPTAQAGAQQAEAGAETCFYATDSVYRLYRAYFLREPEAEGFSFWIGEYTGGSKNLAEISDFFARSPEFIGLYGHITNAQYVEAVYINILGRPGEADGIAYWLGRIDSGQLSRGEMMLMFSESPEYVALTRTWAPVSGYFSWYPRNTTISCGAGSVTIDLAPLTQPYSDLVIVNRSSQQQTVTVTVLSNGTWQPASYLTIPAETQYFWLGLQSYGVDQQVSIEGGSGLEWLFAQYPTRLPDQRSPWTDQNQGAGLRSELGLTTTETHQVPVAREWRQSLALVGLGT